MTEEYLSPSMEDYLEAVVLLKKKNEIARVRDLGRMLNVKNSSVNNAVNILSEKGYVTHEKYSHINLTEKGEKAARNVLRKHNILVQFLSDILKVNPDIAEKDACKMEHVISMHTFNKFSKFIKEYKK